jgi:glycosidase
MADFGYDVSDYVDIHPLFGTLEDMDRLIAAMHARGLRILLDFVPNHSSDQHPWFLESRASRDNPRRDWYIWRDPRPDSSPPNNWLSVFGGSAWEWDEQTGQYYLHNFLKEQPDLNWRNPDLKAAMLDVVRFWLDREVDGFRIDVAHYIMKDPLMRDNPPNPEKRWAVPKENPGYDSLLHIHNIGHEDNHQVFRELREILDSYSHERSRTSLGEIHIFDWEEWARYYGEKNDGLHMPLNFQLLFSEWNPAALRTVIDGLEAAIPEGAWPNYVLGNHDEKRLATRYGTAFVRLAGMLLLTLRGTPTLYYGDEIGMVDNPIPIEAFQDPWPIRAGNPDLTRDPNRTPMQWSPGAVAGFSTHGEVEPWLPIHENYPAVNVASQQEDPASALNFYRRMLWVRRSNPALTHGSYQPVDDVGENILAYFREHGSQKMLVLLNFSTDDEVVSLPDLPPGEILIGTDHERRGAVEFQAVHLAGAEGLVIQLG